MTSERKSVLYSVQRDHMMSLYPRLFVCEVDALDQLFATIGNGYDWEGGVLTSGDHEEERKQAQKDRERYAAYQVGDIERTSKSLGALFLEVGNSADEAAKKVEAYKAASLAALDSGEPELERKKEIAHRLHMLKDGMFKKEAEKCWFLRADGTTGRVVRLSQYSKIFHLPADIQPDWLAAARRFLHAFTTDEARINPGDEEWLEKAKEAVRGL